MKYFSPIILLFCCLFFSELAFTQKIVVSADVSKKRILIGEPVEWKFQAVFKKNQLLQWALPDTIPHFEILDRSKIDSLPSGEDMIITQTLTITSWDSGSWQLPSFFISNYNKIKPVKIEVAFTPFDPEQDYHDVKDIMEAGKLKKANWYWYLVGAILLLFFFLLLFPNKEKKVDSQIFFPDPGIYKTSLARLESLQKNIGEEPKIFYTELVSIFRDYLHKRKGIQSYSKTTDDIGLQIGNFGLSNIPYQTLLKTLRMSDLVKFAKYQSGPSEKEESLKTIKENIITIENLRQ
jgi:hypothetical protein